MRVILCIDDNGGILFNHRRVSSDRIVTEKVREIAGERLLITEFSKKLLPDAKIIAEEQFRMLGDEDYLFAEDICLAPVIDTISELVIFRWNRRYPADFCMDIIPEERFTLAHTEEFAGNSHEKITMEVWA